ncbi:hypothetical protein F8M41_009967 [Gigaspora margarita]|uniref:Uncharacterized protein n=1 Tax=Gigaspora margarita TaxID=4874 RepID=A0A8H4B478_GIGMA|nr:hypothetical protein F8M41_009967 [Gigaspora margarita]
MLNKCNDIKCDYCKTNNLDCKRALPTTQEAFDKIKDKVFLCYCTKEIFNDELLIFQTKLGGTSEQIRNYILKMYDKCKLHSGCQCDFFDLAKICDKCDTTCEQKIATWSRVEYPKEIVGPFEFSEYQKLEDSRRNKKDINEYKANEYEGGIESNKMLDNKTSLEIFKENKDKIPYCKSYESMTRIYNNLQKEKKKKKVIDSGTN